MILATVCNTGVEPPNQELLVFERQTTSARRCGCFMIENGAKDCHGQYDILHSVWPVASDSYSDVPHPYSQDKGHQLRPSSPTREGTCSHDYPWEWNNVDSPRPS